MNSEVYREMRAICALAPRNAPSSPPLAAVLSSLARLPATLRVRWYFPPGGTPLPPPVAAVLSPQGGTIPAVVFPRRHPPTPACGGGTFPPEGGLLLGCPLTPAAGAAATSEESPPGRGKVPPGPEGPGVGGWLQAGVQDGAPLPQRLAPLRYFPPRGGTVAGLPPYPSRRRRATSGRGNVPPGP